jgi:hypothetical protein
MYSLKRLQPVQQTQEKQWFEIILNNFKSKLWTELIVNYCKHNKMTVMNISENVDLFENKSINSLEIYN